MKYFLCKLEHDNGVSFLKINSSSKEAVLADVMNAESCPERAVSIKEIHESVLAFPSDVLWKMYDKPFTLKMVNRKAVKIIEYYGEHSAKVQFVKSGKECTVSRTIIREYTPKTKKFK